MNTKDYFDKYFEIGTILTFFFYKWIIMVLNSCFFFGVGAQMAREALGRRLLGPKPRRGMDWAGP